MEPRMKTKDGRPLCACGRGFETQPEHYRHLIEDHGVAREHFGGLEALDGADVTPRHILTSEYER